MKNAFLAVCAMMAAVWAVPAWADGLSLDKVIIDFKPSDKPIDNINVTNQNSKTLKVTVNAVEVLNSDLPDQKEIPAEKLVVAPKSFEIAPGETRPVRLVLRGFEDDREAVYRVRFQPSEPTEQSVQEMDGKSVQVNVVVTMGALIMAAPRNVREDLKFVREGDVIHFTNNGNVTAQIQREDYCTEDKKVCVPLEGMRIFPGVKYDMKVPDDLKTLAFTQTVLVGGKYSKLSYPAP